MQDLSLQTAQQQQNIVIFLKINATNLFYFFKEDDII